jgi:ferredoxin
MKELQIKVGELLTSGEINIFIGYKIGFDEKPVPVFVQKTEQLNQLIYNANCRQNFVVYLHKPEIKAHKKIGLQVSISGLKTILQLISESQLKSLEFKALLVDESKQILVFSDVEQIENYVKLHANHTTPEDLQKIEEIEKLSMDDKWNHWMTEFSTCIKCYACRAACPLCYCSQCIVECNQPQWLPVTPSDHGNFEWHVIRSMHLAGRCVNCGECTRVCPVAIPVHLLTTKINLDMVANFGECNAGMSAKSDFAMNTFKVDDKENFIR